MRKVNAFTVLVPFMLLVSGAFATTYYVSEFGDDTTGDGSATAPWATIQKAADVAVAGDTVMVDFGEYAESVVPKANGTAGSPVVFMAEEKGQATITSGPAFSTVLDFTLHAADSVFVMDSVYRDVTSFTEDGTALAGKDSLNLLTASSWFQDRAEAKLYVISSDKADPATHTDTVNFGVYSFDIVEGSHITIDGFVITERINAVVAANEVALPGLVITNNVFDPSEFNQTSIYIDGGAADSLHTYEDFLIANNVFDDGARLQIYSAGRGSALADNTFNGNLLEGDTGTETIRFRGDDDYEGAQTQGFVIERNLFNEPNARAIYTRYGDIDSVTIQNNIFYKGFFTTMRLRGGINLDIINNTFFHTGESHMVQIAAGISGRIQNNIVAYNKRGYTWFVDNTGDDTLRYEIDYNYYLADTSLTSNRDDECVRTRVPVNESDLPGGPHAVYGHPMIARPDSLIIPGDTLHFDSTRVTMFGDTVAVDSIPDMWFQAAYPLFVDADTAGPVTLEGLGLVEGSRAIDAGNPDVAPAQDFFNLDRDENPDIGAIEFGTSVAVKEFLNRLFPADYELSQNYPNPFNLATRIEYKLPQAGFVKLTVYNLLGQKVITLVDGIRRNGPHTVTWNARDGRGSVVPSGIYFCRMEAGSVSRTMKMLLLK